MIELALFVLLFIWLLWVRNIFVSDASQVVSFRLLFSLWFGVAYLVTPLAYVLIEKHSGIQSAHPWFVPWIDSVSWPIYFGLVFIAYVGYEFGFACGGVAVKKSPDTLETPATRPEASVRALRSAYLLILLGMLGYMVFLSVYGLDTALSTNIRHESNKVETSHVGVFFLYTRIWIFVGFLILLSVRFQQGRVSTGLLLLALAIVVYTSIQGASRGYFMYLIIVPFICHLIVKRRMHWGGVFAAALVFPVVLVFGRSILAFYILSDPMLAAEEMGNAISTSELNFVLSELVRSFIHPFASVPVAFTADELQDFRYFYDIPLGGLFYAKAFGVDFGYSVTYHHTYNLSGEFLSNLPPGIVASGFYQFGVLGVAAYLFAFGLFSRIVQDKLYSLQKRNIAYLSIYAYFGFTLGNFVMNGDPRVYFINTSLVFAAFLVIFLCDRLRLRRDDNEPVASSLNSLGR